MRDRFLSRGWAKFPYHPEVAEWAARALTDARRAVADPALAAWHVCEGTWFVGVDALDNDASGRVAGSDPVPGAAMNLARRLYGPLPGLHRAQVSAIYPGYPRPRAGESDSAFHYRQRRDAAHLDGLKPGGPARRRRVEECHGFILGLPLTETSPEAAPLVVWERSHTVMRAALSAALAGLSATEAAQADVTDIYQNARNEVFATCKRVEIAARPGECYLVHRLALHGVAPWADGASAGLDGRIIAYFRPLLNGGVPDWLLLP